MIMSPAKQYLYKAFTVLPFTFLLAPFFSLFIAYRPHPDSFLFTAFPFIIYLWYALFVYSGMTLAVIFKRYKFLPYVIIAAAAFLARYTARLPALNLQRVLMFTDEFSDEPLLTYAPVSEYELSYLMLVLLITTAAAGFFSTVYSQRTALELTKTDDMKIDDIVFFMSLAFIGALMHGSVIYLGFFAASYFIARNFILINRELEVYGDRGIYSVSGIRRIFAYYFTTTILFTLMPVIICVIIVPVIFTALIAFASRALIAIVRAILNYERGMPDLEHPEPLYEDDNLAAVGGSDYYMGGSDYYIVFFVILLLLLFLIFRKAIWRTIKNLFAKWDPPVRAEAENEIISAEIITEVPKEKTNKGKKAYKNYLKESRGITDIRKRFLFAYNRLHWELVKSKKLPRNITPHELSEIEMEIKMEIVDLSGITNCYEDIKYGDTNKYEEALEALRDITDITNKTEKHLERIL